MAGTPRRVQFDSPSLASPLGQGLGRSAASAAAAAAAAAATPSTAAAAWTPVRRVAALQVRARPYPMPRPTNCTSLARARARRGAPGRRIALAGAAGWGVQARIPGARRLWGRATRQAAAPKGSARKHFHLTQKSNFDSRRLEAWGINRARGGQFLRDHRIRSVCRPGCRSPKAYVGLQAALETRLKSWRVCPFRALTFRSPRALSRLCPHAAPRALSGGRCEFHQRPRERPAERAAHARCAVGSVLFPAGGAAL